MFELLADVGMGSLNADRHLTCELPPYIYVSGIVSFLSVSVFLKLSALVKLILMSFMSATYVVMTEFTHKQLFINFDRDTT